MFQKSDQDISGAANRWDSLVGVFQSANEEQISLGQKAAGVAKAYICAYEEFPETFSVEVFFHLKELNRSFRFTHEKGSVQRFRLKTVEDQALEFVESFGFMMDNMQIQNVPVAQRQDLLGSLPIFSGISGAVSVPKPKTRVESGESPELRREEKDHAIQKIARLLSGF